MSLPFFTKKNHTPPRQYLLALEIDYGIVKSAIWSVVNGKSQVLSVSGPLPWDGTSDDSLVAACDKSLTESTNHLDSTGKLQPQQVIFGLPPDWLVEEKINPDRLKTLKVICQKLSLKPVGFVITPEAIVRFLQSTEGTPVTAILLGIWPHILETVVVRLGKTDHIYEVARSGDIVADVTEGLSRFTHVDMLPSRILLYNSETQLEDVRQQLLAHPWKAPQTHLPFLHFPKIEILPADYSVKAIALAGGTEVAKSLGLMDATPPPPPDITPSSSDLGFVADTDVTAPSPQPASPPPLPAHPPITPTPARLVPVLTEPAIPQSRPPKVAFALSLPRFRFRPGPILLLLILLVLPVALGLGYWFLPRAEVALTVQKKTLEHEFSVSLGANASDSSSLAFANVESTVSDSSSLTTTGTKLIGDKATGTVTVINGTSVPKTFPAATEITSPSGLKFTFDSSVDIASASGTADPNSYQPGKAEVKITAAQIGTDSNLSAGTQFRIGSFSTLDFVAKNDAALSGGSSRQVQAVSKDDIAKLRSELTDALKAKAKEDLLSQASSADIIIPESIELEILSEELTPQVGEVSDSVTLSQEVKAAGINLKKEDLDSRVLNETAEKIPDGWQQVDEPEYTFTVTGDGADAVSLSVRAQVFLTPIFDTSQITRALKGRKPDAARDYLAALPGVNRIEFTFTPPLPAPILTLPRVTDHIHLLIEPSL